MHVPPANAFTDRDELRRFMVDRRVGHLVVAGPDGLDATLLPLLVIPGEGDRWGFLRGHLARGNPMARSTASPIDVLVIFAGADAYVSPSYYPTKAEDPRVVPTWNYELVHAHGRLHQRDDPAWLLQHVEILTDRHEHDLPWPKWGLADAPADYIENLTRGIVGIEIELTEVIGKRKLSQNRPEADRAGVLAALESSERADDRAVARAMRVDSHPD